VLGFGEEFEGALVAASGFRNAVEAGNGLDVVVEDLGARGDDHAASFGDALEIGSEDFDAATGSLAADLGDDVDEGLRGAEVVVVAIHAGDHGVGEAKLGDGIGDASGLFVVNRFGLALGDRTEAAAARANVAEHHEGRGLLVPALADVGAVGGLADGVEVEVASQLLKVVKGLAHGRARLEPGGLGGGFAWGKVDLDQHVGMPTGLKERSHLNLYCRGFSGGAHAAGGRSQLPRYWTAHVCAAGVDRTAMLPDLLLAFASVAVLLSPVVVDAGLHFELRREPDKEADCWEEELPS